MQTDERRFPRVLVVNGEPFNRSTATGLTLISLFKEWPREKLACLYLGGNVRQDDAACLQYWVLGYGSHSLLRNFLSWSRRSQPTASAIPPHQTAAVAPSFRGMRPVRAQLAAAADLGVYSVPTCMQREIEAFEPQVIYSLLGANTVMRLAMDFAVQLQVPIVPHFMDDWPTWLYGGSIFRGTLRRRMRRYLHSIFDLSRVRLVIGEEMSLEYARRYGAPAQVFMNTTDCRYQPDVGETRVNDGPVRIVYVGGLHLDRWRSLLDIQGALVQLRSEGVVATAHVHTQTRFESEARQLHHPPVMFVDGSLDPSAVDDVLRSSDIVLHVESFNETARLRARFSVSTKIPQSMAAGRALLAYGPGDGASASYIRATRTGLVVGAQEPACLLAALRELISSAGLRRDLGNRGLSVARERHESGHQRERFRRALCEGASGGG